MDSGIYKSAQRKLQLDAAVLRNDTGPGDSEAPVNENAAMQQLLEGLLEPSAGGCASETPEPMSGPDAGAAAVDLLSIEPSEAEAADCGPSSGGDAAVRTTVNQSTECSALHSAAASAADERPVAVQVQSL